MLVDLDAVHERAEQGLDHRRAAVIDGLLDLAGEASELVSTGQTWRVERARAARSSRWRMSSRRDVGFGAPKPSEIREPNIPSVREPVRLRDSRHSAPPTAGAVRQGGLATTEAVRYFRRG